MVHLPVAATLLPRRLHGVFVGAHALPHISDSEDDGKLASERRRELIAGERLFCRLLRWGRAVGRHLRPARRLSAPLSVPLSVVVFVRD